MTPRGLGDIHEHRAYLVNGDRGNGGFTAEQLVEFLRRAEALPPTEQTRAASRILALRV